MLHTLYYTYIILHKHYKDILDMYIVLHKYYITQVEWIICINLLFYTYVYNKYIIRIHNNLPA